MITKSELEINELIDKCSEQENTGGSMFPRMTYEEGIKAALQWLFNDSEHPLDE